MINRLFFCLLLLACTIALTASANAQITVSSHTNIATFNGQEHIVITCQTLMQDADIIRFYPNASVVCTVNQNGAIQTLPECFGNPNAVCTVPLAFVVEGGNYQTTATAGQLLDELNDWRKIMNGRAQSK